MNRFTIQMVICAIGLTSCAHSLAIPAPPASEHAPSQPVALAHYAALPTRTGSYLGVYEPHILGSYRPVEMFARGVGRQPNIVVYYSAWHETFQARLARQALAHGATVFVQIEPFGVNLASIAAGHSDSYLRAYATAVRDFGHRVILSFGHEVNGPWYPWGTKTSARVYVAAWRHIVTVFRHEGAGNVTWMWAVNVGRLSLLNGRYPGSAYVNWIGVTGYLTGPGSQFSVISHTISYARRLAPRKPVIIDETGVAPGPDQPAQIRQLFQGMTQDHLLGIVYFDVRQSGGVYHQDWRLEDHPAGLAAFRQAVRRYMR